MRFIECKDCLGENCLIDPMNIQLVEQYKEDQESITVIYLTNGVHVELIDSYEEVKEKLKESMNWY